MYLQHKMITITVIQKTVEAILEQKVSGWGVGFSQDITSIFQCSLQMDQLSS